VSDSQQIFDQVDRRDQALRHIEPYVRRARSFSGWSLGDVDVRPLEPGPPWEYEAVARDHASRADAVLDLGTGGGEVLSRVIDGLDARVTATEPWTVNALVARGRLAPLGVPVVRCSSLRLPFRDASFDLVLDRHEELDPSEVARVLRPGGRLVTQQVGHDDWAEVWPFFPNRHEIGDHFRAYADGLRAFGLAVTVARHYGKVALPALGDIAFMLLLQPWRLPDFDPARDVDTLLTLEDALRTDAGIVLTESRYLLTADKDTAC
jgi:SAM-dependent methyltransferase